MNADVADLIQDLYVSQLKAYKPSPQVSHNLSLIPVTFTLLLDLPLFII